jgi:hypothetical protein
MKRIDGLAFMPARQLSPELTLGVYSALKTSVPTFPVQALRNAARSDDAP